MVTLKDIALECEVSRATVSKVMNGYDDISPETVKLVRAKAEEMGYLPNLSARSLKTHRTYNLGIVFADALGSGFKHEYFINILNSFKNEAERQGYSITFLAEDPSQSDLTYLEQSLYRNFDGVLIACADYDDPDIVELLKSSLPTVTTDFIFTGCSAVRSDNVGGMQMLMNYIFERGHRRIAFIHGDMNAVTKQRLASFYKAFEDRGLVPDDNLVLEGRYRDDDLCYELTRQILSSGRHPTCILYPDDFAITGGVRCIEDMGLRIPDDMSIAGFDGSLISRILNFTTVAQDTDEIGKTAAKFLINEISHPKSWITEHITIPCRLVPGQTVISV